MDTIAKSLAKTADSDYLEISVKNDKFAIRVDEQGLGRRCIISLNNFKFLQEEYSILGRKIKDDIINYLANAKGEEQTRIIN